MVEGEIAVRRSKNSPYYDMMSESSVREWMMRGAIKIELETHYAEDKYGVARPTQKRVYYKDW